MDRIQMILTAPEAQGANKFQAEKIAYETTLTPTQAIMALRATPVGQKAAAVASWAGSVDKVRAEFGLRSAQPAHA